MPILERLSKHQRAPVSLIFNGASLLGVELAKLLIEQGAFVIIVDEYTRKQKDRLQVFLQEDLFAFVDISGIDSLIASIDKLDYVFYLSCEASDAERDVSTSEFLERSNALDKLLDLAAKKNSKFLLASSFEFHKALQGKKGAFLDDDDLDYTMLEVQRYAENLTWEYHKKGGLDIRIVRVGEILGEGVSFKNKSILIQYIEDAISGKKLKVEGDGLESFHFIHVLDAAFGLIKAQFTSCTTGHVYSLIIPRDITVLNLAYKILDLEPRAEGIDFVDKKSRGEINVYKPAKNLTMLGWKPKVSFERALAQTIDYIYKLLGEERAAKALSVSKKVSSSGQVKSQKKRKKSGLKKFLINFFFEVKEKEQSESVLDNARYKANAQGALGQNADFQEKVESYLNKNKKLRKGGSKASQKKQKIRDTTDKKKNSIFKKISCLRLLFGFFFLVFLVIGYVYWFVPGVRIAYHGIRVYSKLNSAGKAIEDQRFSKAGQNLEQAHSSLGYIDSSISELSVLSFNSLDKKRGSLQSKISVTTDILNQALFVTESMASLTEYADVYESSVVLNAGEDFDFREVTDYDLQGFVNISRDLADVEKSLESQVELFDESNMTVFVIGKWLATFQERLILLRQYTKESIEIIRVASSLLAVNGEEAFAILLLNEGKMNARGGEIAAAGVFNVEMGKVLNIEVYESSEVEVKLSSEQNGFVHNDLQLLYPEEGLKFKDLTLLSRDDTFEAVVRVALQSKSDTWSDHIVILNLESIKGFLALIGSLEVKEDVILNASNIEEEIANGNISYKVLLAGILDRLLNFQQEDIGILGNFGQEQFSTQNIMLYTDDTNLRRYLTDHEFLLGEIPERYDSLDIALISESKVFPSRAVQAKVDIDGHNTHVEYNIQFKDEAGDEFEGLCTLSFSPDFEIKKAESLSECIEVVDVSTDGVFLKIDIEKGEEGNVTIRGMGKEVVKYEGDQYNYNLLFKKLYGLSYDYSLTLDYGEGLELISSSVEGVEIDKGIKLDGSVGKDVLLEFEFVQVE